MFAMITLALLAQMTAESAASEHYLACYQKVAQQPKWTAQSFERLSKNEAFALAVLEGCPAEVAPLRPAARERAVSMLQKFNKEGDAKLLDLTERFVMVRAILADWPDVQRRLEAPVP